MKKSFLLIVGFLYFSATSFSQVESRPEKPDQYTDSLPADSQNTLIKQSLPDTSGEKDIKKGEDQDIGLLYRYEMGGGIIAHSTGFGINFRKGKHITGFKKKMWEIELVNMKHPKEYKSYHSSDNGKGYFYGKQNSFAVLRPGIGIQKVICSKTGDRGVEVRYLYFGGPSIGLLKPVYLEIRKEDPISGDFYVIEKYDPQKHREPDIYGKAPYFKGITEMKIVPGIYGKFGLNFDYSDLDNKIRAIETGITIDLFYNWREKGGKVPIMAKIDSTDDFNPNKAYFLSFYINILYGNKW
ncbi:MAG: hypothetical protein ABII90_09150 [Bacteroidota bacterium]